MYCLPFKPKYPHTVQIDAADVNILPANLENFFKDQSISPLVIILFILITFTLGDINKDMDMKKLMFVVKSSSGICQGRQGFSAYVCLLRVTLTIMVKSINN